MSPYYEDELGELRTLLGADRLLMGSDYPHAEGLADPTSYIKDLKNFDFSDENCELVMRENGIALSIRRPASATDFANSRRSDQCNNGSTRTHDTDLAQLAPPRRAATRSRGPRGPFELIEEEVLGTPIPVFANRPRTIVEILRSGAEHFAGRPYMVFPERELSFDSVIGPVAAVARSLKDKYGVGRGDRVAICSANCVEFALTFWAVTVLGGVTVALNGWWTGPEMAYALSLTEPKLLVGDRRCLDRLSESDLPGLPRLLFEEDFAALEAAGAGAVLPDEDIDEDDPFLILFTSGTTGRPKGAMISHRSNIHFGLATRLSAAEGMATAQAKGPAQPAQPAVLTCSISASPMFHVAGLNCSLVLAPLNGLTIVYPPAGKWSEASQLELTDRHGATMWSLVPTQLWRLLDWPGLGDYDLSSLRTIGGGSAVWAPSSCAGSRRSCPGCGPA